MSNTTNNTLAAIDNLKAASAALLDAIEAQERALEAYFDSHHPLVAALCRLRETGVLTIPRQGVSAPFTPRDITRVRNDGTTLKTNKLGVVTVSFVTFIDGVEIEQSLPLPLRGLKGAALAAFKDLAAQM